MNHKDVIEYLPRYLDDDLDKTRMQEIKAHLEKCKSCMAEFNEYQLLYNSFEDETIIEPVSDIKNRLLEEIEREKLRQFQLKQSSSKSLKQLFNLNTVLKVAAVFLIIISSYWFGRQHQQLTGSEMEVVEGVDNSAQLNSGMLALLDDQSASKRLEAILNTEKLVQADERLLSALTNILHNDDNINVRLYTVEALSRFIDKEQVRTSFISALEKESNPNVQIALIHALVSVKETRAVSPLQELLNNENTEPFVKKQLEELIPTMI